MTWAFKRQLLDVSILAVLFLIFAYIIIQPYFDKEPTCVDGRQNGTETGVDCGGTCAKACVAEIDQISILWSRAFKVLPGRYNAVAYLENPNKNIAAERLGYRFRFADANNVYIGKREGTTYVPPSGHFVVFEPGIDIGNSIPVYATFEFMAAPKWIQVPQDKASQVQVLVSDIELIDQDTHPRLSATVKNNSLFFIPEVDVVAILYDASHNAVSTSRTYLDQLAPEEVAQVTFTWPEPIPGEVVEKEIISMFNIFLAKLK